MTDLPPTSSTSSSAPPASERPSDDPPGTSSRRWVWGAAALGIVALIVIVALVVNTGGDDTPDTAADTGAGTAGESDDAGTSEFEERVVALMTDSLERFNSEPIDVDLIEQNPMAMNLYVTQLAIETVTEIDASTPTIVINTELEAGGTIVESDTSEGARGICNVAMADTYDLSDEIEVIQILASTGEVLADCEHARPS